ncbi:hypothetical protein N7456_003072 [Penicillium angulare]|uniref:DUF6604 domain-containing protein n=1 Tax=Penicillium angulare TaxID=116970 RepID=A0A9W9KIE7_9EURO|nr:hypothetical protein N7456_003072 [Penicillium angulare]
MKNYATEIAKHQDTNPIPDWILREIRLIINARKEFNEFYRECARLTPNPSLLRSNVGDEARIQNLIEILEILDTIDEDNEALMGSQEIQERAIFRNSFSGLTLDSQLRENDKESSSGGSKNNGVSTPHQSSTASNKSKHKHEKDSAKGNQRSTKGNQRISRTPPRLEEMLEERPLEDYRIDDQPYKLDDYLMAIYSLFKEIMKLRYYLQDIWSEVVYDNLDIAIAGCLCNIAIQKIKEAQSDVFIENPRFDSFDSVAQVITAGEPKRPFCMKALSDENRERHINHIIKELYTRKMGRNATNINFDVKEEFLFNSYQALLDFLVDYKKSNNGSPTKRMLRTIKDWEPFLNFERACKGDPLSNKERHINGSMASMNLLRISLALRYKYL